MSTVGSPRDDDDSKKRIRVACDTCRRKKIKCNGEHPCSNCTNAKRANDCVYKVRAVKRRIVEGGSGEKRSTSKQVELMDRRLTNMEQMLWKIQQSMEMIAKTPDGTALTLPVHQQSEDIESESDNESDASDAKVGAHEGTPASCRQPVEVYVGNHSIMCIFSHKSIDWIEQALGREGIALTTPIRNLPIIFFSKFRSFIAKWVDPPLLDQRGRRRLFERPFPLDRDTCFAFLHDYTEDIGTINRITDLEKVKGWFTEYYDNISNAGLKYYRKRRFKASELLMMSSIMLMCITCKIDSITSTPGPARKSILDRISGEDLLKMKDQLFINAIAYYHRVCVISEGLDTVKGILLLMLYIETNWLVAPVNYMLGTVAIRFAQEMGLHRSETYENLPLEEQSERRQVWWFCYFFDVEICFRTGKPPIIDISDVTTNRHGDFKQFFIWAMNGVFSGGDVRVKTDKETLMATLQDSHSHAVQMINFANCCGEPIAGQIYLLVLAEIRAQSYNRLFSARARELSFTELMATLDDINHQMTQYAQNVCPEKRPRFWDDPEFQVLAPDVDFNVRESHSMQLAYFLHLMLINRVPLLVQSTGLDSAQQMRINRCRHLCMQAARTILHSVRNYNKENCSVSYFNWIAFFPSSAFLCLVAAVINHPQHPEAVKDIELLVYSSQNFFSMAEESPDKYRFYHKEAMVGLITRLMLKVATVIYELRNDSKLFSNNPPLQQHFENARVAYPELFLNSNELAVKLQGITGDSPFVNSHSNPNSATNPERTSSHSTTPTSGAAAAHHGPSSRPTEAWSPSMNPAINNILDGPTAYDGYPDHAVGVQQSSTNGSQTHYSGILRGDFLTDSFNPDPTNFFQMDTLPNFFYDNNVGL
ncbi:transcription factor Tac1p [Diutina catenulata]